MRRTVLTNGHVLSMDPAIGEIEGGAVLIEDDRILAVGRDLDGADAEVIDAEGGVIMPGFVDTHRHTWQTALRGICSDWTLLDYFLGIRSTLSPRYTAQDVYVGNLVDAIVACLAHPAAAQQTFLVSDGEDVSTPELIRRVAAALDRPARLVSVPLWMLRLGARLLGRGADFERLVGDLAVDASAIRRELGWQPPYSMQSGLEATAKWYRSLVNP